MSSVSSNFIQSTQKAVAVSKRLLFLRHGEAMHNPRAEAASRQGCSAEEYLKLTKEDDILDAPLTESGEAQALGCILTNKKIADRLQTIDLVVASPLSRTLHTADLVVNTAVKQSDSNKEPKRICLEHFRELHGIFLNTKRSDRTILADIYCKWDLSPLESEEDRMWTANVLEEVASCSERGYQGLLLLMRQMEEDIMVVTHGALLMALMIHSNIRLMDRRLSQNRSAASPFGNAELREFVISCSLPSNSTNCPYSDENHRPIVTMTEVTDFETAKTSPDAVQVDRSHLQRYITLFHSKSSTFR